MNTLQSRTGPVQGQNRVFPVYFSHTGRNMFSLQGSQVIKAGFSLLGKVHRENPVFIKGMGLQCIWIKNGGDQSSSLYLYVPAPLTICIYLWDPKEIAELLHSDHAERRTMGKKRRICLLIPYARRYNPLLIRNRSWILTIHKSKGHST